MNDVLWYAVILAASTMFGPLLLAYLTNRNHKTERLADWARQDAVAKQAADAAQLLLDSNARIAAKTDGAAQLLLTSNATIAAKTDNAAQLLLASNATIAAKTDEAAQLLLLDNKKVAMATALTNSKLDVIHTLVNSNMTAALQAEAAAVQRELVLMRELIALHATAGNAPSVDTLAAVKATEDKISELNAALADRRGP